MLLLNRFIALALITNAAADELSLKKKDFFILHSFSATALPAKSTPIKLKPEEWTSYRISSIKGHSAAVKKGDSLISYESEEISRKIADSIAELSTKDLQLQQAEADLATLQKTIPRRLAHLKRSAEQAMEELDYFNKTSRKSSEEAAEVALQQQQQMLASTKEELKQLLQMYEADDITEETEEIILQNQRDSVEYAEFILRREKLNYERAIEVSIPRKAISLAEARDNAALELESGSNDLPRSLELKKLEIAKLQTDLQRASKLLKDLQNDRKTFELEAPSDGTFYYGSIEAGKWTTGELVKNLRIGGSPPLGQPFATFIPSSASLEAHAFLDQATTLALGPGASGTASLDGSPEINIPVKLMSLDSSPGVDEKYHAVFDITWPNGLKTAPGQNLEVQLISYSTEDVIAVPTNALTFGPQGWSAEVKLADGKTEQRPVTRGKSSKDETVITGGLEAGQVIIVP
ncbi:hypothetical protein [Luteolibacter sp. AS25]|uniref:efflux RND transporter periplasmic adaptor subunit n=1 Tax=Luteolibacter sp. AS25 TaxID=3135776 RepID=UPI00398A6A53